MSIRKLAGDYGEAAGAVAAWQPEDMAEAVRISATLAVMTADTTYMWSRLADHAEASGYLHPSVASTIRLLARWSAEGEDDVGDHLARFPLAARWR